MKREFVDGKSTVDFAAPPQRVLNWEQLVSTGLQLGPDSADVVVVEFTDLECPACRRFHHRLEQTTSAVGIDVKLILHHFPLTTHRFARIAARALECADDQGAAPAFVDVAYANQDSFGLKPWTQIAAEAGVRDSARFDLCTRDTAQVERIEHGLRLAELMELRGTPSVIIEGWRFASSPNDAVLREALLAVRRGEAPPGAARE